jgi:hypothetical protein
MFNERSHGKHRGGLRVAILKMLGATQTERADKISRYDKTPTLGGGFCLLPPFCFG